VKVFLGSGRKADQAFIDEVEARLDGPAAAGAETGRYEVLKDAGSAYVDLLLSGFGDLDLTGTKVLVDAANGAMSEVAPLALERLGAEVLLRHGRPDGRNINDGCGALHPEGMARAVRRAGAHLGVSYDGDGDRAIFADERGRILDGDATMAILARDLLARDRLPGRKIVTTVMSNLGLATSLSDVGVGLVRTPVGDRFVVEAMERGGYALGGEQSGHIVVRHGKRLIGDGLETTLLVLGALVRSGEPLSSLGNCFARAPQTLLNVRVRAKPDLHAHDGVAAAVRDVEARLGDRGRVVLRYSGTEPLARVMVEANDLDLSRDAARSIADVIQAWIGSDQ
jgi:phosphoglucosamine mutase